MLLSMSIRTPIHYRPLSIVLLQSRHLIIYALSAMTIKPYIAFVVERLPVWFALLKSVGGHGLAAM